MNAGRVLHQQLMQLRYHFLACVGLIMVVPLEEIVVGLVEGYGDYRPHLSMPFLMLGPLLTALIACATVQADLDEKRCLFWQSKPVRAHAFLAFKYVIGLVLGLAIVACPVGFVAACSYLMTQDSPMPGFAVYALNIALISVLTYSTSFLCNVLVRRTARAWLIGMALAGFVLLIPFMLPLPAADVVTDVLKWMAGIYLAVTLSASVVALCLALAAMHYRWHLRTNLRVLLWSGAGLIFLVAVLLGRQVANIKILDEVQVTYGPDGMFVKEPGRYELMNREVTIADDGISVRDLNLQAREEEREILLERLRTMPPHYEVEEGLQLRSNPSPRYGRFIWELEGQEHAFALYLYSRRENVTGKNGREVKRTRFKKVYLRSFQRVGQVRLPVSTIDLSDCIIEERHPRPAMRRIEDKLIVFIEDQCLVVRISDGGQLELIERKKYLRMARIRNDEPFTIPLLPAAGVDIRQRVKLSVDVAVGFHRDRLHMATLVSDYDRKMHFALVTDDRLARYDVLDWDQEKMHCQFRDARAFLFGGFSGHKDYFVQDGKFYVHNWNTLMVFDIRADHGIRKLGHFQRYSDTFSIGDIGVEKNGNIVLFSTPLGEYGEENHRQVHRSTLYLLKGP
ncbi:MAG: hypothetical protein IH892_04665 [Planctomycetes bacterium]|nr:hypothetical protein [Planctomycetota bacterium]